MRVRKKNRLSSVKERAKTAGAEPRFAKMGLMTKLAKDQVSPMRTKAIVIILLDAWKISRR